MENLESRQLLHAGEDHGLGLEVLRIDAGATAPYTDSLGNVWQADNGFIGGGTDVKTFAVAGTNDVEIHDGKQQYRARDESQQKR